MKRTTAVALIFLLLLPFTAPAQQINEVIEVSVVEMEVVVLDAHGKPVSGLNKDDFEVREHGQVREITNFFAVDRGEVRRVAVAPTTPEPQGPTPPPEPREPAPPTHFVFFVDNAHIDLRQRNRVLESLRRFIGEHLKEGADASLISFNHNAKVRVPFTKDKSLLLDSIAALEHESTRGNELLVQKRSLMRRIDESKGGKGAEEPDILFRHVLSYCSVVAADVGESLNAMNDALQRLKGASGRKVFVHVSAGIPQRPGIELVDYWVRRFNADPGVTNMTGMEIDETKQFKNIIAAAQSAGVPIYTIDAGGLTGYEESGVETGMGNAAQVDSALIRDNKRQPLQLMADETGGRSIINENDFDHAFEEISETTTTYYSLGIRGDGTNALRKLDVRVKRPWPDRAHIARLPRAQRRPACARRRRLRARLCESREPARRVAEDRAHRQDAHQRDDRSRAVETDRARWEGTGALLHDPPRCRRRRLTAARRQSDDRAARLRHLDEHQGQARPLHDVAGRARHDLERHELCAARVRGEVRVVGYPLTQSP